VKTGSNEFLPPLLFCTQYAPAIVALRCICILKPQQHTSPVLVLTNWSDGKKANHQGGGYGH